MEKTQFSYTPTNLKQINKPNMPQMSSNISLTNHPIIKNQFPINQMGTRIKTEHKFHFLSWIRNNTTTAAPSVLGKKRKLLKYLLNFASSIMFSYYFPRTKWEAWHWHFLIFMLEFNLGHSSGTIEAIHRVANMG